MSAQPRREFEAERYRQQVMLHEILARAQRLKSAQTVRQAQKLLNELTDLEWTAGSTRSMGQLERFQTTIVELGRAVNVTYSNEPSLPKWLKFFFVGFPAFILFVLGFLIIERRRRLKVITKAELDSLEEKDEPMEGKQT